MMEVTIPGNWSGWLQKGRVGKGWSLRDKTHMYDPEHKSCNAGRQEYNMRSQVEFSTEPTKEEWLSSGKLDHLRKARGQDNS